jgi:hypothetical protein
MLVRSKENEQSTNNIKVTKPGLTALERMSSTLTNDNAKQTNIVIENTRSGICWYLRRPAKVAIKTAIINHCCIVINKPNSIERKGYRLKANSL